MDSRHQSWDVCARVAARLHAPMCLWRERERVFGERDREREGEKERERESDGGELCLTVVCELLVGDRWGALGHLGELQGQSKTIFNMI